MEDDHSCSDQMHAWVIPLPLLPLKYCLSLFLWFLKGNPTPFWAVVEQLPRCSDESFPPRQTGRGLIIFELPSFPLKPTSVEAVGGPSSPSIVWELLAQAHGTRVIAKLCFWGSLSNHCQGPKVVLTQFCENVSISFCKIADDDVCPCFYDGKPAEHSHKVPSGTHNSKVFPPVLLWLNISSLMFGLRWGQGGGI